MKNFILLITFLVLPVAVYSQEESAIKAFTGGAYGGFVLCEMEARLNFIKVQTEEITPTDYLSITKTCLDTSLNEVTPKFDEAKKEIKNPAAMEALKELYIYWKTSMKVSVISQQFGEPSSLFGARVDEKRSGIEERIDRLELEL